MAVRAHEQSCGAATAHDVGLFRRACPIKNEMKSHIATEYSLPIRSFTTLALRNHYSTQIHTQREIATTPVRIHFDFSGCLKHANSV